MTREQHSRQAKLCARFGVVFILASIVTHTVERYYKVDLDLGFTFLWVTVLMLALGFMQHLKFLDKYPSLREASNIFTGNPVHK